MNLVDNMVLFQSLNKKYNEMKLTYELFHTIRGANMSIYHYYKLKTISGAPIVNNHALKKILRELHYSPYLNVGIDDSFLMVHDDTNMINNKEVFVPNRCNEYVGRLVYPYVSESDVDTYYENSIEILEDSIADYNNYVEQRFKKEFGEIKKYQAHGWITYKNGNYTPGSNVICNTSKR